MGESWVSTLLAYRNVRRFFARSKQGPNCFRSGSRRAVAFHLLGSFWEIYVWKFIFFFFVFFSFSIPVYPSSFVWPHRPTDPRTHGPGIRVGLVETLGVSVSGILAPRRQFTALAVCAVIQVPKQTELVPEISHTSVISQRVLNRLEGNYS